ncbi:P-selectin glycoprotein ligand 1 [Arapaima gigas]
MEMVSNFLFWHASDGVDPVAFKGGDGYFTLEKRVSTRRNGDVRSYYFETRNPLTFPQMAETQLLMLWMLLNLSMVISKEHDNGTQTTSRPTEPEVPEKWRDSFLSSTAASRRSSAVGSQHLSTSITFTVAETANGHPTASPHVTTRLLSDSDAPASSMSSSSEKQDQFTVTTSHMVKSLTSTQHKVSTTGPLYSDPQSTRTTSVSSDSTHMPLETTHNASNFTSQSDVSTRPVVPNFHPESSDSISNSTSATTLSISFTNSSKGAPIPKKSSKELPVTRASVNTKRTSAAPERDGASKDPGGNPCTISTSRRDGLVSQCLIAIASLAAVATIFLVCTIVLCTKLSTYKHRYKMVRNQGTEMVCISSLLPDGEVSQGRPRISKSNGALIPSGDESEGDDLTLHSFLPENDRNA